MNLNKAFDALINDKPACLAAGMTPQHYRVTLSRNHNKDPALTDKAKAAWLIRAGWTVISVWYPKGSTMSETVFPPGS